MLWASTKFSHKSAPSGERSVSDVIDFARLRGVQGLDTKAVSTQISYKQDPILALRQALNEAGKAGDIDALISMYADDVIVMPPNDTTLYGRAECREWYQEYYQYFRIVALSESEREVTIHGDFALERSGYMIAIVPVSGGSRIRDNGRSFNIWKRRADGSWKIWQSMWNSVKPVGSGTNRYLSRLTQKKTRGKR